MLQSQTGPFLIRSEDNLSQQIVEALAEIASGIWKLNSGRYHSGNEELKLRKVPTVASESRSSGRIHRWNQKDEVLGDLNSLLLSQTGPILIRSEDNPSQQIVEALPDFVNGIWKQKFSKVS